MQIKISYFYKIRFFTPDMIPVSTAVWGPKWYKQGTLWTDKRGVINGAFMSDLQPGPTCSHLCRGREACSTGDPSSCEFLKAYKAQLDAIDWDKFIHRFNVLSTKLSLPANPTFVLMVHEARNNPCSERWPLIQWFNEHGYELEEVP